MPTETTFRPSAVIFDMDGLMLDTETIYQAAWRKAARELGYRLDESLFYDLIGLRTEDCEAALAASMGEGFSLAEFHALWEQHWDAHARTHGIATKPGLWELLRLLEALEIPKAVATSSTRPEAERSLGLTELRSHFAVVVTGDQIVAGKPAPDIYLEAARRLRVVPEQCVAFEDSSAGTLAAAAAGMRAYMIPDLLPPTSAARQVATAVLPSLHAARELFSNAR